MKKIILDLSDIIIILISIYIIYMLVKKLHYFINEISFNFLDLFKLKIEKTDTLGYILIFSGSMILGIFLGNTFIQIINNISKYNIIFQF